jgi:Lipocalin-like domain
MGEELMQGILGRERLAIGVVRGLKSVQKIVCDAPSPGVERSAPMWGRHNQDWRSSMGTRTALVAGLLFFVQAGIAVANDNAKLVGTWKLVSFDTEFQNGEPARPFMGQKWVGYTVFTNEGRTMSVWEAEGRTAPNSDADRAALLRSMNALTGTYRYEGGTGIVEVDVAANPAGKGRQVRGYQLDGNRLQITTPWTPNANIAGSPMTRSLIRFERAAQ